MDETDPTKTRPSLEAKELAEARAADAAAEKARAESAVAWGLARTNMAEAELREIKLAQGKRDEQQELAKNQYHFKYTFDDAVDWQNVNRCIDALTVWSRTTPGAPITIVFYSPGGSVIAGMALFDFIRGLSAAGHHITTHAIGYAASMAGILLQAGDTRVMGPESYLLIHEISSVALGKIGDIEDEMIFLKKIQHRVVDIFTRRSGGKISRNTFTNKWRRKDWWLDSVECMKYGFVDEVR